MKFRTLCTLSCACALSQTSLADVKSLSSTELTETYIEDSTIIVTPAPKRQAETPRQVVTYTIGPGEPVVSESEEQADLMRRQVIQNSGQNFAEEVARQENWEMAFIERQTPNIAPLTERTINVPGYPDWKVPEGPFNLPMLGENLGISSDGQTFTFSIGNIPGVDTIRAQEIQSQTVNLVPRPGGGFDLTIEIPRQ